MRRDIGGEETAPVYCDSGGERPTIIQVSPSHLYLIESGSMHIEDWTDAPASTYLSRTSSILNSNLPFFLSSSTLPNYLIQSKGLRLSHSLDNE